MSNISNNSMIEFCLFTGCDYRGIINETNGQCLCKELVGGPSCNTCLPGFWNLTKDNPKGCERKCPLFSKYIGEIKRCILVKIIIKIKYLNQGCKKTCHKKNHWNLDGWINLKSSIFLLFHCRLFNFLFVLAN